MVINNNMSALFSARQEGLNTKALQGSMEKLSSGSAINKASDDASGLAVSEKMRAQIKGLNRASKNVGDMVSFTTTAEGYLNEMSDVVQRIRELAVQAGNGIYSEEDRQLLTIEVNQLVEEVDRIASQASFNGLRLFSGRFSTDIGQAVQFQIGANMDENISVNIEAMTAEKLGLKGIQGSDEKISLDSQESSNMAIGVLDNALSMINRQRADLGAVTNRAQMAQKGIDIAEENLIASSSRIKDTDMAKAIVEYTKNQLLQSTATAMLSQANSSSQNILNLLR